MESEKKYVYFKLKYFFLFPNLRVEDFIKYLLLIYTGVQITSDVFILTERITVLQCQT